MIPERRYLGNGWKFPVRVNARGGISFSSAEEDIAEAIWVILGTRPGEREMLPGFGCGMHDLVFSPNSEATRGSVAHQVREALTRWEPRADVLDVRVESPDPSGSTMLVRVDYRVRSNNTVHNLVYPFSVQEGTAT